MLGALAAVAGTACGFSLQAQHFNDREGHGPLRWKSDCAAPDWWSYDRKRPVQVDAARAEYAAYFACLKQEAGEDERFAVSAVDQGAKEEHDEVVRSGQLAGFIR